MTGLFNRACRALAMPSVYMRVIQQTASRRYKTYSIPKRTGGVRTIHQPAPEVKSIQRWIIARALAGLPIHASATAYGVGCSIRKNAAAHIEATIIAKTDFRGFFPSIRPSDLSTLLDRNGLYPDQEDREFLRSFLFYQPKHSPLGMLTIGAPSSPYISNAVMVEFDRAMYAHSNGLNCTYTRYADDITFGAPDRASAAACLTGVRDIIAGMVSPRLVVNERKTVVVSKRHRQQITGLVLTPDGQISIGRDRKRAIKANIHKFLEGRITNDSEKEQLRGHIAFAISAEPTFYARLKAKYGAPAIHSILQRKFLPRNRGEAIDDEGTEVR